MAMVLADRLVKSDPSPQKSSRILETWDDTNAGMKKREVVAARNQRKKME